jgi:hypothetical protein
MIMLITQLEVNELVSLEKVISEGLNSFIEVGEALCKIRDERLYRAEFKTFEEYCRQKWGMSKTNANRLIQSAEIVTNLTPIGVIPSSESVIRPLTSLTPEKQKEAWEEAVKTAPNGKVTAEHVEKTVKILKDPLAFGPEPEAYHPDDDDSDNLFQLKRYWRKATKKDKHSFLQWANKQK